MNPDQINGTFEFLAAVFVATVFFFAWGVWNVYFYPSQALWWSFYGGLCVVVTNLIYVIALLYYRKPRKASVPKWTLMFLGNR